MKQLFDFLLPVSTCLSLSAMEEAAALREVTKLLHHDSRIINWEQFSQAILEQSSFPLCIDEKKSVVIYHTRTNAVQDLVMAVGRSSDGIFFKGHTNPISLIFVIGIPNALNNEYLRMMGTIARLCKDSSLLKKLLSSKTTEEFMTLLTQENNQ